MFIDSVVMGDANTLLLFDIDGTILKTSGAGMRAMRQACRQLFGDDFTLDGINVSGHLDPLIFAEAAVLNGLEDASRHHDAFRDQYVHQLKQELHAAGDAVYALPGILQTLKMLRQQADDCENVTLGLLTGNFSIAAPIKLKLVGVDPQWFEITAFGDEASSRPDLVALAMNKYRQRYHQTISPNRVVVIGDTPRDIACARAHGCVSFAVATGAFQAQELTQAGADIVVEDLSDPSPLFELIG